MRTSNSPSTSWWTDIALILIVLGSLYFILLGSRPLFVPDEGRYAEIAREMAVSGDFVTPYLNNIKYFEKPILFYWLGAAAIKLTGVSLWSIRSINVLLGLLGCLTIYVTSRKLYGRATGLISAFVLGTSTLYFVMAHMVSLDLPVTVFIAICLCSFLLGTQNLKRRYFWLAAASAALAVLTKGLIGIVFPGLIIGSWLCLTGEWRRLKYFYLPSGLLIFFIVAAPWHILVAQRNPEFAYFYFVEQHFLRYTQPDIGHYQPNWFFIPVLAAGFVPWIIFLPQAFLRNIPRWNQRHLYSADIFLLLWATLIFVFFSFSNSKLIPYILPMFPALAMLIGHYLVKAFGKNKHARTAAIAAVAIAWLFCLTLTLVAPRYDHRTILPLAEKIKPLLKANDEVITYNQYYQDLPFYLERRVSILNWKNELTFGMQHQDTREWMINDTQFWQRWNSKNRVFVVISKDEYRKMMKTHPKVKAHVLGETLNNVVISNK